MLLRDRLNEFELDWAQAAVRSELIPLKQIKGKKILILGREETFEAAVGWSFAAWNDERKAGVRAVQARYSARDAKAETAKAMDMTEAKAGTQDASAKKRNVTQCGTGEFETVRTFTEEAFAPAEADCIVLTGCINRSVQI